MCSTIRNLISLSVAASLLLPVIGRADVIRDELPGEFVKVYVSDDPWQPENLKEGIPVPVTYTSGTGIFLDGLEKEAAWAARTPSPTLAAWAACCPGAATA